MQIELFHPDLRLALGAVAGGTALLAMLVALLGKRRLAALLSVAALLIGSSLLLEGFVNLLVIGAAPDQADYNEYRWILLSPWSRGAIALGLVAGIASVVMTALSTRRIASHLRWSAIVGLRVAAAACALVLFLQPAVELRQVAREPNRIAIVVDDSASMELADKSGGPSRRQRVGNILRKSAEVIEGWRSSHIVDVYNFSEDLVRSELRGQGEKVAVGKATLLRQALAKLRRQYEGNELAGIIAMSDGVVTGDLAEIGAGEFADFARELDTPVHTVWTAESGLKDYAVSEIRADEFAFVRTVTRVEAVIQSTGYGKRRIAVTLSSDGKAMRRKWVELGPGESKVAVAFEFTPSHVGKYVYKISIPVREDEAVVENNAAWFVVRVIRDKIRVLQVAGQPSWDVRALRGMLKQNPNVDLISFFILRTEEDIRQAPNNELSLIPFPTRELFEQELPSFDLVVLQNFNYGPYGIGRYLENIRSYVEGGGGLMMLGGPLSFASGGYADTPVAKALPVELASAASRSDELLDLREFSPKLTELGGIHPVTALRYEKDDNRSLWKSLPALEGVNKVLKAKRDAAVLAVHPKLSDKKGDPMPVIVAGDYGRGRSLAVTTDSLWRWGFVAAANPGNDGRHYLKFWDNAIRWLIQDPELRYLHISSDKNSYAPGAKVKLNLRLQDQDYSPLSDGKIRVTVHRGFDPNKLEDVASLELTTDEAGEAQTELLDIGAGVYRVTAKSRVRGREVEAHDIFLVDETDSEHLRPAADAAVLKMLSELSEGQFIPGSGTLPADLKFIAPKVVRVDKRSDVPLWSRGWLLLCALAFLGLEWVLRQRSGTL